VFLDRDGTLIHERHYLRKPEDLLLLPRAREALSALREHGFLLVVATNQSGIARGLMTENDVRLVHAALAEALGAAAALHAIYVCPHGPDDRCACRKPSPGLLLQAASELNIDLERSFMVGDKHSDLLAGERVGCRGVLVRTGYGAEQERCVAADTYVATDLADAAHWILRRSDDAKSEVT
jgi:D-glycero-D-manno-heptose 1,7-bisphosphate phosphatase